MSSEVKELLPTSQEIWKSYAQIPSEEMWSIETIIIPLKQILYYHEAGIFINSSQALLLIEKYEELLRKGIYNVTEVAYLSGFSSCSYFCKSFKQKYKYIPSRLI